MKQNILTFKKIMALTYWLGLTWEVWENRQSDFFRDVGPLKHINTFHVNNTVLTNSPQAAVRFAVLFDSLVEREYVIINLSFDKIKIMVLSERKFVEWNRLN